MVNTSFSNWKQLAKDFHLGKVFYHLYYAPKGFLEKCSNRGHLNMAIDHFERLKMEQAATHFQLSKNTPYLYNH